MAARIARRSRGEAASEISMDFHGFPWISVGSQLCLLSQQKHPRGGGGGAGFGVRTKPWEPLERFSF